MNLPRIYQKCPLELYQELILVEQTAHHLTNVLRLTVADKFIIFNGNGREYLAEIIAINKKITRVIIHDCIDTRTESPLNIHLAQGISRGEKMDFILQKAVELGITEFTPLFTDRCNVKLPADRIAKRLQHWQGIIISACEQSGRTIIPTLHSPINYRQWLSKGNTDLRLILHPHAQFKLNQLAFTGDAITIVIGPEGGLTDPEIVAAETQGFQRLNLGPRILRTETAPLAAITALQYQWGDMR